MNRRLIISEEEKNRILNLHETRKNKEWNLIGEQVTGKPGTPVVGATPEASSVTNTPTQASPTKPSNTPQKPNNEELINGKDKDYDYKKVGDKYYFKIKENPYTDKLKTLVKQGKFKNWTPATKPEAIKKISQLPFMPYTGDGSEETFDAPVQTVGTTPTAATPTSATTTSATTTSATTTSAAATTEKTPTATQNPDLLADLKTASQIRQEFRQGKKDKNKATRHYNQMVNKYNRLKSKMSPQDNTAYLQAMSQLKQQMETLSKENYN